MVQDPRTHGPCCQTGFKEGWWNGSVDRVANRATDLPDRPCPVRSTGKRLAVEQRGPRQYNEELEFGPLAQLVERETLNL